MEKQSEHPLAEAVVNYFGNLKTSQIADFESITGKGAKASVQNKTWLVGNKRLLDENRCHIA